MLGDARDDLTNQMVREMDEILLEGDVIKRRRASMASRIGFQRFQ
jgi:hypothetical protein